jgi:hypothetical protein
VASSSAGAHWVADEHVELEVQTKRTDIEVRRTDHQPEVIEQRSLRVVDPALVFENPHAKSEQFLVIGLADPHEKRVIALRGR